MLRRRHWKIKARPRLLPGWSHAKLGRSVGKGSRPARRRASSPNHHRDRNHDNNPPDGSNWELLCLYCHDNEHQRQSEPTRGGSSPSVSGCVSTYAPFADLKERIAKKQPPKVKQTLAPELWRSGPVQATPSRPVADRPGSAVNAYRPQPEVAKRAAKRTVNGAIDPMLRVVP